MSLTKLPLLLSNATLFWIGATPPKVDVPAPAPSSVQGDKVQMGGMEHAFGRFIPYIAKLFKSEVALACLGEAVLILILKYPRAPLCRRIMSLLSPSILQGATTIHTSPETLIGAVLIASGTLLRLTSYRALGNFFTYKLLIRPNHTLITTGPYAYVRHPSYTGFGAMVLGATLALFGRGSAFEACGLGGTGWGRVAWGMWMVRRAVDVLHLGPRMGYEDAFLREEFGEEWEEWARRTPWRVIPYVY